MDTAEPIYVQPGGRGGPKTLSVSNGTASGLLTTTYAYDAFGAVTSVEYPSTMTLSYTLDSLERPTALTGGNNYSWASNVQYTPAGQIASLAFPSGNETWLYNTLLQLTQRKTVSGSTTRMNVTYNYNGGTDNGQIANSVDAVTGETINYQYDSLKRLISAYTSSGSWGTATRTTDLAT